MTGPASRGVNGFLDAFYAARQARREDEDHNRYLAQLRSADMAQPGAESAGAALDNPNVVQSLTPDTLRRIGSAGAKFNPETDLAFSGGRRATVGRSPSGSPTIDFQDTAPQYRQTATGVVIDRNAARSENIGDYMDRLRAARSVEDEVPWYQREGFPSEQAYNEHIRATYPERFTRPEGSTTRATTPWESFLGASPADQPKMLHSIRAFTDATTRPDVRGTGASSRLLRFQHNLDTAQRDVEDLERDPQYEVYQRRHGFQPDGRLNTQPGSDWVRRYNDAHQRFQAAQDAVDRELQLGGAGSDDGSGGGAGGGGGGATTINLDPRPGESRASYAQRLHDAGMDDAALTRLVNQKLPASPRR